MADTSSENPERPSALTNRTRLNDFSHRDSAVLNIENPSDLLTEATPAQKERLVFLVDDALDTMETLLHGGKEETRLKVAENVLDRAGVARNIKQTGGSSGADIPASALVEVIQGLSRVFGGGPVRAERTVSPDKVPFAVADAVTAPDDPSQPNLQDSSSRTNTKKQSKVPESLMGKHR